MMSLESRTIARKRASLRSRRAVTWSTVRAARRPTTRVETIANTTIAMSSPVARMPSALTSFLSVFGRPHLEWTAVTLEEGSSGGPGLPMGRDHRPGGGGRGDHPRCDLGFQAPGEVGGVVVGGQAVEQGVGDLRPHPLPVLTGAQDGEVIDDGRPELGDALPDLGDAGAGEGRAREYAGSPRREAGPHEMEGRRVVGGGVGRHRSQFAVGLVD